MSRKRVMLTLTTSLIATSFALTGGGGLVGCDTSDTDDDDRAALGVSGGSDHDLAHDDDDDEDEIEIPLDEVPDHVKDAAIAAVPGIVLEEAEMETEDGVVVYDLEGEVDGVEYEVEVAEDGTVLEVEEDDDDDDDH
ncbi:MAG: PepSY domain-containing protein [Phycisphaerales bacterium]